MSEETIMKEGWRVRATAPGPNVRVGDEGEARKTGMHEFHLVYWLRQKATSFHRASDMERIK